MTYTVENAEINTRDIIVDPLGQRDVNRRKSQYNRIMREFDPKLVNDIKVAEINGSFYCIDGQMTRKVLIARNGGRDLAVKCKVFHGLTMMDAAEMFVNQNGAVSKVLLADKLRVLNNYGDPETVDFVRQTELGGLEISWQNNKGKNVVTAVSALLKCYRELTVVTEDIRDSSYYYQFCKVLHDGWEGRPEGLNAKILGGLSYFMRTYKGMIDIQRLTEKLRNAEPREIIHNAAYDRSSGNRKYAVQILDIYNSRLSADNKLPNNL